MMQLFAVSGARICTSHFCQACRPTCICCMLALSVLLVLLGSRTAVPASSGQAVVCTSCGMGWRCLRVTALHELKRACFGYLANPELQCGGRTVLRAVRGSVARGLKH